MHVQLSGNKEAEKRRMAAPEAPQSLLRCKQECWRLSTCQASIAIDPALCLLVLWPTLEGGLHQFFPSI